MIFVDLFRKRLLFGFFIVACSLLTNVDLMGMADRKKLEAELDALNRPIQNVHNSVTGAFLHRSVLLPKQDGLDTSANDVKWTHHGKTYIVTESAIPAGVNEQQWVEARRAEIQTKIDKLDNIVQVAVKADADARVKRAAVEEAFKQFKLMVQNPKFWLSVGAISALAAAGYFGTKYVYKKAIFNMNRPTLVRESSRLGFLNSFFHTPEEVSLDDMVFAPELEEATHSLAEATLQTRELGLPYENVLFYGPPGTGKTEFARTIAKYSDMDYAIISGADFSQFKKGQGVTEVHRLFEWAENSKRGLIIFVDEADACFADRAMLDKERIDIVNAFLSHTGGSSDKFMLILATNYDDVLDPAIRSRMHKKLEFKLPGEQERFKIFKLKLENYIINYTRKYEKDDIEVEDTILIDSQLNDNFWKNIAIKTDGFSGRDIDYSVQAMRREAIMSGTNMLTQKIVDKVIASKAAEVERDQRVAEKQRQLFKAKTGVAAAA